MLRRLLSARSSGRGLQWRTGSIVGLAPSFTSAAASGGSGGSGSGNVPPPAHPHAPIHWKGHNLKPLRIKKRGIEVVQVRGCFGGWLVDEPCVALGWGVAKASLSAVHPRPSPPTARRTRCTTRARASNTGSGTASTSGASCRRATWTSRRRYRGCVSRMYALQCMLRTWQGQTRGVVDDGSHTHELARMKTFFKFLGSAD